MRRMGGDATYEAARMEPPPWPSLAVHILQSVCKLAWIITHTHTHTSANSPCPSQSYWETGARLVRAFVGVLARGELGRSLAMVRGSRGVRVASQSTEPERGFAGAARQKWTGGRNRSDRCVHCVSKPMICRIVVAPVPPPWSSHPRSGHHSSGRSQRFMAAICSSAGHPWWHASASGLSCSEHVASLIPCVLSGLRLMASQWACLDLAMSSYPNRGLGIISEATFVTSLCETPGRIGPCCRKGATVACHTSMICGSGL